MPPELQSGVSGEKMMLLTELEKSRERIGLEINEESGLTLIQVSA